ncbi:MAG: glycosyltransferase [Pirellula sp.]|jgi:glycosyltransferase involved in cell wall biosynthesis
MKIDLLITELNTGGAERCCASLATYLVSRQHCVRLFSLGSAPKPPRDALVKDLETVSEACRSARAHGKPSGSLDIHFLNASHWSSFLSVRKRLMGLVHSSPPDVAQSFLWHANLVAASVYPKFKVPLSGGVRVVEPRRWRAWFASYWSRRMERVVCVSDAVADWCHKREGIALNKLQVIPNGVSIHGMSNQGMSIQSIDAFPIRSDSTGPAQGSARGMMLAAGISPRSRILLFVGRFERQKGVDVLMERAEEILTRLPEHRMVLLGEGPLQSDWLAFRDRSKVGSRIDLLGQRDDVLEWMRCSELLLLPARYEGMPNVVLEAMSVGLPVAVTRVEGIESVLGEQTTPQSVPRGEWGPWVDLVVRLASQPELRATLGRANQERAASEFSLAVQLAKYEALFREIAPNAV